MASMITLLGGRGIAQMSFSSASFRKQDDGATHEKRSGVRRGGLDAIQARLGRVPNQDEALAMPLTPREIADREKRREQDFEERKAARKERLKNITNQWADNRLGNSSLEDPHRASWARSGSFDDSEDRTNSCGYFLCCFG